MIRSTSYGSAVIEYTLTRSPRSSLSISVLPDGAVTVTAPEEAEPDKIDERVRRRARWILRQQRRFAEFRPRTPPRQFVGGETHRYLGRQYRLKIDVAEKDRVLVRSGRLVVETRFPDDRDWTRVLVRRWMRQRAREVLKERYDEARPTMAALGIEPPPLMICPMKKRWGQPYVVGPHPAERHADRGATRLHRLRDRPRTLPRRRAEPFAALLPPPEPLDARLGAPQGSLGKVYDLKPVGGVGSMLSPAADNASNWGRNPPDFLL